MSILIHRYGFNGRWGIRVKGYKAFTTYTAGTTVVYRDPIWYPVEKVTVIYDADSYQGALAYARKMWAQDVKP